MKRMLGVFAVCAMSAMAADMTGYIMDTKCSTTPAMMGNEACAKKCMGDGSPAVLATADGKFYKISNQDKVKAFPGKKVTVTGKVNGDTITVDTIASSKT